MALLDALAVSPAHVRRVSVTSEALPSGTKLVTDKTLAFRKTPTAVVTRRFAAIRILRKEAMYAASPEFPLGSTDTTGHYSAVVKQNNVPLANCRVGLYWRDTMLLIAKTLTDENGAFKFDGLVPDINRYFAIALDPDGGVFQNALIYDRITPIK